MIKIFTLTRDDWTKSFDDTTVAAFCVAHAGVVTSTALYANTLVVTVEYKVA